MHQRGFFFGIGMAIWMYRMPSRDRPVRSER
jgi:hypothetical protein